MCVRRQKELTKIDFLPDVDVYRVFVADRFTKDTAVEKLRDQLKDLAAKSLPPTKAWDTVRKYSFCFNEKAKRNATEELTHEQISYYFANALHPTLAQHMRSLLLHNHPMKFDSSHALTAAQQYVDHDEIAKDKRVIKKQKIDDSDVEKTEQSAMLATKPRHGRRRAKRQRDEQVSGATKDLDKKHKPSDSKNNDKSRERDSTQSDNLALPAVGQQQNRPATEPTTTAVRNRRQQQQQQSQQWRPQSQQQNQPFQQQFPFRPRQQWNAPTSFSRPRQLRPYQQAAPQFPPCPYCGRYGHPPEKCWLQFPHLRPRFMQQRQFRPPPSNRSGAFPALDSSSNQETQQLSAWSHPADPCNQPAQAFLASSGRHRQPQTISPATRMASTLFFLTVASMMADPSSAFTAIPSPTPCACLLCLQAEHRGKTVQLVIDTGATVNLVSPQMVDNSHPRSTIPPYEVTGILGRPQVLDRTNSHDL